MADSPTTDRPKTTRQPLETHHLSHDLRGPLNSMLGFTELLLDGIEGPLNEIQVEDITAIRQSAKNLLHLINTVVDLGRLDAQRLKLSLEPLAVAEVVDKALADLREDKPGQAEAVAVDLPDDLPAVQADPDRAAQMLSLLLHYLLAKPGAKQATVSAAAGVEVVVFRVASAGVVIAADNLPGLFEATVDIDEAGRSKITEGGLTLPLVFKLAQAHQGQVSVASAPDAGTTFTLTLPAAA